MARVWAARLHGQRGFQKLVAIKTILPHLAEEPEFERMFLDEARIASGVHHPNVCEIYELGEEKRTLYLVMEWVSGDSLSRVLRSTGKTEAIDARVVARIIADACAGLHVAHELTDEDGRALGVVHRDLSPHNILLSADGNAKVADFGVAKALGQLHEATSAGQLKGKIAYMAPEQVTGSAIDRRSDVFSLGCVLYEATTGQRPFRGDGDHQVMHAVLKGDYAPPSSLMRGYPQELERIVTRALSPQPILRYPTAERMRFALEEFVARGQLVTQSNVAQVVRARIGEQLDRRKDRIRQASSAGDREGGWSEPPGNMTPSNQAHGGHRSGVKPSGNHASRPLYTTMQMDRPPPPTQHSPTPPPLQIHGGPVSIQQGAPMSLAPPTPLMASAGFDGPASSTTIPQANAYPMDPQQAHAQAQGHTPVSHPGASYSQAGRSNPAHGEPPPKPFAQTALMPPTMSLPPGIDLPSAAGAPPTTAQMRAFSIPPVSSVPPGGMHPQQGQQDPQHYDPQRYDPQPYGQNSYPDPNTFPPGSLGSPFGAAPLAPPGPPERQAGAGQYFLAIGVGVLLAVLIGVGGFYVWRGRRAPMPGPDTSPSAMASAAVPVPVPLPLPVVASAETAASAAPTTVSADIVFRIDPADTTLSIEGKELAADVRTVPRPAMGKTVNVVAHSKGHEDTTVLVDYFTTSPMELTLKAAGAGAEITAAGDVDKEPPKEPARPNPGQKGQGGGGGGGEGARPRQPAKGDPGLPANPY